MPEKPNRSKQLQTQERDQEELMVSEGGREGPEETEPVDSSDVTPSEAYDVKTDAPRKQGLAAGLGARGNPAAAAPAQEAPAPLFSREEARDFHGRWDAIQVGFVDEPQRSVEQADKLVAETMRRLAEIFVDERTKLEQEWDRGADVSTEDLRQALKRYRSFFGRLLSM
jgi:hypothetical protein